MLYRVTGQASWSFPLVLPNVATLNGARVSLQTLYFPTSWAPGFDLTNAVEWRLGG